MPTAPSLRAGQRNCFWKDLTLNGSKTAFYIIVWVPRSRHFIGYSAWLDSLSSFQLRRSSFIDGRCQHLQVPCLRPPQAWSTSLQRKMAAMEPWLPRTPSSINVAAMDTRLPRDASVIKMADIKHWPSPTLDKMATSTQTDIVLITWFTTSLVARHPA